MNVVRNIVFDFPSRTIGGTQFLYMRTALYLSKNTNYKVWYIDYSDGFACNQLENTDIGIIEYNIKRKTIVPNNSIIIIQLNWIDLIDDRIEHNDTVSYLIWGITPASLTCKVFAKGIKFLTKKECTKIGENLKDLALSGNVNFMDYENYYINSKCFNFAIDDVAYLPVFINDNQVRDKKTITLKQVEKPIRFAWLGRLDFDKIPTLMTFMNELNSIQDDIMLYVIGSGDGYSFIKEKEYSYPIEYVGSLIDTELDNFIDENVDVGLGMGLSAMEFAKRGIPVIIHGFMKKPLKAGTVDNYIFVHQMHKYTPGTPYVYVNGQSNFIDKVKELESNYNDISMKDYEYICSNHTCAECSMRIIKAIENISKTDYDITNKWIENISKLLKESKRRIDFAIRIKHFFLK